ncbi:MAG: hypothetical protein MMC33_002243 [Icmadophila ericetorum]|nr:hypothetical protein [Icmadophila ericetorum]
MSSNGRGSPPSAVPLTASSRSSSVFNNGQEQQETIDFGTTAEDFLRSEDDFAYPEDRDEIEADERVLERPIRSAEDSVTPEPPWPQKYYGPASTWRSWTAAERGVATSLDQLKSNELSAHLYNAHVLKSKARRGKIEQDDHPDSELDIWEPPRLWTAWPMPADEVPRGRFKPQDQEEDEIFFWQNRRLPSKLSSELEDALTATLLRTAKEKFLKRRTPQARVKKQAETKDTSDSQSEGLDQTTDDQGRKQSKGLSTSHEETLPRRDKPLLRPVVMADDDRAGNILKPTVRNILSDLDKLLMALHNAHQSYTTQSDGSQSESPDETEKESRSGRSRSRSRSKKSRQKRKPQQPSVKAQDADSDKSEYRPETESSTRLKRKRSMSTRSISRAGTSRSGQPRLSGQRDWSDIIGMASLTGFSATAIKKASQRCAALFGEGIIFRTLPENTSNTSLDSGYRGFTTIGLPEQKPENRPAPDSGSTSSSNSGSDTDMNSETPNAKYKDLPKGNNAARAQRRKARRLATALNYGKIYAYYCPISTCTRSQRGFSRAWNLKKHVEGMHPQYDTEAFGELSDDELVGGVHVDGFLQPIKVYRGWRGPGKGERKKRLGKGKGKGEVGGEREG